MNMIHVNHFRIRTVDLRFNTRLPSKEQNHEMEKFDELPFSTFHSYSTGSVPASIARAVAVAT